VMFYDYNDISTIQPFNYSTVQLIAWSMGVFIAYLLKDKLPQFERKIAINGTPFPVDDEFGIPKKVFDLTLAHARTGLEGKFYKNVMGADFERFSCERSVDNCVEELHSLSKIVRNPSYEPFYDLAIIGAQDKIVPTKNQINFWQGRTPYELLETGHFPFYNYTRWSEMLCK